ncbi:MAG: metallophosphoesterase family protein [Candidatus Micrarchaeaceae archaeon]
MKIGIVSDLHIGYERFREDARLQAKKALDMAVEKCDAILIPGDIFDYRIPTPDVIVECMNVFMSLDVNKLKAKAKVIKGNPAKTEAPIIAISGTHERRSEKDQNPLDILSVSGILIDSSNSVVEIRKDNEIVYVHGIKGVSEERFLEEIKRVSPKPLEGHVNILMFHQSLYELLPYSSEYAKIEDLPEGFDLYIDGHIHHRCEMKAHGKPLLIPGSTVITQLKEQEQESKGFYIYDTKEKSYEYHYIDSRKFFYIKEEYREGLKEYLRKRIVEAIESSREKPIISIDVSGTSNLKLDYLLEDIKNEFKDKAIIFSRKEIIEKEKSRERAKNIESAKELAESILAENIKKKDIKRDDIKKIFDEISNSKLEHEEIVKIIEQLLSKLE